MWHPFCLVPVRLSPRPSQSIHFGDVTKRDWPQPKIKAKELGKYPLRCQADESGFVVLMDVYVIFGLVDENQILFCILQLKRCFLLDKSVSRNVPQDCLIPLGSRTVEHRYTTTKSHHGHCLSIHRLSGLGKEYYYSITSPRMEAGSLQVTPQHFYPRTKPNGPSSWAAVKD